MTSTGGALEADILLRDTSLILPEFPGQSRVEAKISPQGDRFTISATGSGPGGVSAKVTGTMSQDAQDFDLALKGRAPAALSNPFIVPRRAGGVMDIDLRLNGAAALENLNGSVKLKDGSLSLPNLRLAARDLSADVGLRKGKMTVDLEGAPTKGGRLKVAGSVDLVDDLESDIIVTIDQIGASDPALYDTVLGGEIAIKGPLSKGGKITGQIEVGETILRIPEAIAGTYGPIPGMVHLREDALSRLARERAGFITDDKAEGSSAQPITHDIDMRITAPARIFIRGRGLDAELGGSLRIEGDTGNPLPSGSFELRRGRLDLLGQRLDLTEGVLRLSGSFNPVIRLVAQSTTEIGTASIVIEGPASSPQLTLSSVPELPQDEVLAMILFGKSITDMTAIEGLKLANAVRALTGGGGFGIMGKLRSKLDVDDLEVSTSNSGEAQVGVGKYLADGVYANTSVMTSGETRIELNYEINDKITARGEASSAGSAGLGLFYEKNY